MAIKMPNFLRIQTNPFSELKFELEIIFTDTLTYRVPLRYDIDAKGHLSQIESTTPTAFIGLNNYIRLMGQPEL